MEKMITIDGKQVRFKTNGAIPMRYKAQFGKDYFKEILKMLPLAKAKKKKELDVKDLEVLDFEVFYNVAWVMAKTADPSIPEPLEWLSGFEEFPMIEIFLEIQDLMNATLHTSKKKLPAAKK
jgi:hypothetical protein